MIEDPPSVAPPPATLPTPAVPARPGSVEQTPREGFVQRHQLLSFYVVAFAISWVGILLVVGGPANVPGSSEEVSQRFLSVMLAWLAGPSAACLLMTGVVSGRAGYRDVFARSLRWLWPGVQVPGIQAGM